MRGIELIALNKDFEIVSLISYTNLQWNRKFHEPGTFSVQIPLEQYSDTIKYLYTKDRDEMGEVSQVNYKFDGLNRFVALSGYFLENRLNSMIAYQKADNTNITNQPSWASQKGPAEDVAHAYFDAFKKISFGGMTAELDILEGLNNHKGKQSDHARRNEELGHKIYTILKPSRMSYKVKYDLADNNMTFICYQGIDRTTDNVELTNPVIFSTAYNNLQNPDVLLSSTDYRSAFVNVFKVTNNDTKKDNVTVYANATADICKFIAMDSQLNADDYASASELNEAINAEGLNELENHKSTISVDFDTSIGGYEYLVDFDLGDLCAIEIPELNLSADAVLTGIYEVIKDGTHSLSLEFDSFTLLKGGI